MGKSHHGKTDYVFHLYILLFLFLLGLITRFIALGQEAFFIDEVVTARVVDQPVWEFVKNTETSPPLFLYIMKYWMSVFGTGHVAMRSFSALAGSFAAPLLFLSAVQFSFRRFSAAFCGVWMAVAPLAIWHSQQARYYGMQSTLVALYLFALACYLKKGGKWGWIFLTCSIFLGFSQHYFFVFVPLSVIAWFLYQGCLFGVTKRALNVIAAHVVAGCCCLVYLPLVLFQLGKSHTTYIPTPGWHDLVGTYTQTFLAGPFHEIPETVLACFFSAIIIACLFACIARGDGKAKPQSPTLVMLLCFAIFPVLIPFSLSLGEKSIFLSDRYTIVALPGFILSIGFILNSIREKWLYQACTTIFLVLAGTTSLFYNIDYYTTYQDFDWRGGIKIVRENFSEKDQLIFLPGWMRETYENNGGKIPEETKGTPENIWLFVWEQNPNELEKEYYNELRQNHSSTLHINFPHIKLWQFTTNQNKEKNE